MKILLINTPRSPHNMILESAPAEAKKYIHKRLIGPPLGLLTVAEAVKDHDVVVFDTKGEYDLNPDTTPPLDKLVLNLLKEHKPDVVGTTTIASEFYYAIEILKVTKSYNPEILTVAGGLHTTLSPNDFTDKSVDLILPGQSAFTFRKVIEAKEKGIPFENIAGIIINKNGILSKTAEAIEYNSATEDFLFPNRKHLERWKETYIVGNSTYPSTYLFTSLGCPYKCTFCSIWCQYDGRYLKRNIESIIDELKQIDDYPIVRFSDANTVVDTKMIDKLFDRIHEEGIKKTFVMDIRTDTAVKYPKLIEKLAKAGLKVVICGFESFREEELKKYNKSSEAKLIHEAINIFHQNNIMLRGNYVIPNDYDEDDFNALSEYTNSHKVTYAGYTILTPMPGTPFYEEVKDQIIDFDLSKYNFFNSVLKTKLPLEKFYENVGKLWLIKKGTDVI
ncbi:MAG: B12-binding domain-containing radical SAM protein [Bacteroidales bacterium]|nr:B12-binding domain-containing radical SAM protein [Bacteroidales bacterium]